MLSCNNVCTIFYTEVIFIRFGFLFETFFHNALFCYTISVVPGFSVSGFSVKLDIRTFGSPDIIAVRILSVRILNNLVVYASISSFLCPDIEFDSKFGLQTGESCLLMFRYL